MKKTIALLVALLLTSTVALASCNKDENSAAASSAAASSAASSEVASAEESSQEASSEAASSEEESSEAVVEESSAEESVEVSEAADIFTYDIDRTATKNLASAGAPYTAVTPASENYPDAGNDLTNGIFCEDSAFSNAEWAGFSGASDPGYEFVIDLGSQVEGIADFVVNSLGGGEAGIWAPSLVTVSVSTDGENWIEAGSKATVDTSDSPAAEPIQNIEIQLEKGCAAQYVKFTVAPLGWTFLGELAVYTYGD